MNDISFLNQTTTAIKEINELKKLMDYAIKAESLNNIIFSVIFVNNNEMKRLNFEHRHINETTDVLSFAFEDSMDIKNAEYRMLGEIYISVDKAKEQANEYGHAYLRELSFLMIHGFLHLLGYDHMDEESEKEMFKRQEEILNEFGIKR
jgi:probable rRNA maturation factor